MPYSINNKRFSIIKFLFIYAKRIKFILKTIIHFFRKINPFISHLFIYTGNSNFVNIINFEKKQIIPNLIILGAQRCGTTSLHNYLKYHPDIFMSSPVKEPCYFLPLEFMQERRKKQGYIYTSKNDLLKNCMLQGYKNQSIFGESSTFYTMADFSKRYNIPISIKNVNKEMKFIYAARNPFSRIISHFKQVLPNRRFEDINQFIEKDHYVITNTKYSEQIFEYLEQFPIEQIMVYLFEDFINDPKKILDEICHFLNLDLMKLYPEFIVFNKSQEIISKDINTIFSQKNFHFVKNIAEKEMYMLNKYYSLNLDQWDLSENKWCNNKN